MLLHLLQLNKSRILFTRTVAILLGVAAILSAGAVILMHGDLNLESLSPAQYELLSVAGAAGAIGFFALLMCMGVFWLRCDDSSKLNKTVWFVLLAVGFFYGTQVAYYVVVYLPAVVRKHRFPGSIRFDDEFPEPESNLGRFGPFNRTLLLGWLFVALAGIATLTLPRSMPGLSAVVAMVFFICSAIVVFESLYHFVASLYRTGIRRSARRGKD
jgi:hypothetical protein